jgi:hypothetical protein
LQPQRAAGLDAAACVGAALGAISFGLGGASLFGGLSTAAKVGVDAGAFDVGIAGETYDILRTAEGEGGTYGSVNPQAAGSAGYSQLQIANTVC